MMLKLGTHPILQVRATSASTAQSRNETTPPIILVDEHLHRNRATANVSETISTHKASRRTELYLHAVKLVQPILFQIPVHCNAEWVASASARTMNKITTTRRCHRGHDPWIPKPWHDVDLAVLVISPRFDMNLSSCCCDAIWWKWWSCVATTARHDLFISMYDEEE